MSVTFSFVSPWLISLYLIFALDVVFPMQGWSHVSSLGRYVFGSEISYNKAPPRLPGLGC